jgi:hypothetical protein
VSVYPYWDSNRKSKEHNSLMSSIEGVHDWYRFGLLLFPAFNSDTDPDAWLNVYWLGWDFIAVI